MIAFKLQGLDALQSQLISLGAELASKTLAQAARKAFKPVLEAAKALVPVDTGELREAIKLTVKKPKGGDAVVVVGLRIAGSGTAKGITGIAQKYARRFGAELPAARRWHWIELGTANTAAQAFLRPALDQNAEVVLEALKAELVKSIARVLRKQAKGAGA